MSIMSRGAFRPAITTDSEVPVLGKHAVAAERTVTPARDAVDRQGRAEIIRDPLALLFGCRVQQPHQQEKGHHRGDEIGISHFPGTAMMPASCNDLFPFDDDRRHVAAHVHTHHLCLTRSKG
jgi:hypothetical protein